MAIAATVIDMETGTFEVEIECCVSATTLLLRGELDLCTRRAFREAVEQAVHAAPSSVIVDASAVAFVDSSGLAALIGSRKRSAAAGIDYELRASARLESLLRRTGLLDFFGLAS